MSNFLIFKAAFNNSATPAIGTYTAEGASPYFNRNLDLSPDFYLYGNTSRSAVRWFVPTTETTDFEFVADILTTEFNGRFTYFIIADSTGTTRLRMWSLNNFVYFANDDSNAQTGTQYIGSLSSIAVGEFEVFHRFRFRVRKLTASSSSVEVYVDGTLKLAATAGASLVTCTKIGFMGGVNDSVPLGNCTGIQNTYLYDLSGGDVIDRGVLSEAFNRFINWMKSKFALKSDIPTVNNGTLTIQQNGTNVQTFTANQSTNATANITVPTAVSELANDSGYLTASSNLDASKLTSGTVDIARLPQGALERLVKVANEAARYALTTAEVQLGDTVQQLDTGIMYVVTDVDHLDSSAGYTEYTAGTAASVPWSGVTGKPTFAAVATSGAYSDLTGVPTIPTVNNATLTIQRNGTTIDTFTANASVDKTINISTTDDTKIPLAGTNALAGSIVPDTDNTYDFGSSTYKLRYVYADTAYVTNLNINGSPAGDILTHNASEFVDVTTNQTIGGTKTFSGSFSVNKPSPRLQTKSTTYSSETSSGMTVGDIAFLNNSGGFSAWIVNQLRDDLTKRLCFRVYPHGSSTYKGLVFDDTCTLYPEQIQSALGTSTNKWKTINGLNPSDLSLPGDTYITIDTTNFAWGSNFTFTPTVNGYLFLNINSSNGIRSLSLKTMRGEYYFTNQTGIVRFTMPVYKNKIVTISASSSITETVGLGLTLFPLQGNV